MASARSPAAITASNGSTSPPSSRPQPARASGTSPPASTRSSSRTPSRSSPARPAPDATGSSSSSSTAPAGTPSRSPSPKASASSSCRPTPPSCSPPKPSGPTSTNPSSTSTSTPSPTSMPSSPSAASPSATIATSSEARPDSTGGRNAPTRSNHPEIVSGAAPHGFGREAPGHAAVAPDPRPRRTVPVLGADGACPARIDPDGRRGSTPTSPPGPGLDAGERQMVVDHGWASDFPETAKRWLDLGREAGFTTVEALARGPRRVSGRSTSSCSLIGIAQCRSVIPPGAHVLAPDAGNRHRLLHRVAAERLAELLVEDRPR